MYDKCIIICDLDNCIADDSWRKRCLPYDFSKNQNQADFDDYNNNAKFDCACNLWIFEKYKPAEYDFAFFTSRPDKFYLETFAWIKVRLGFTPTWLFMRPQKFNLNEVRLKRMWARQFCEVFGKDKIIKLFDDNQKVCNVYAEIFGVEKAQCVFCEPPELDAPPPMLLKKDIELLDECPF